MSILKKIKNTNFQELISRSHYLKYVDTCKIDDYAILLECQHGTGINGNIFYILKELCSNQEYENYHVYLSVNKKFEVSIKKMLDSYSLKNIEIIILNSDNYFKKMASVKYLINDNTFLPFFIKKEGQVYLNTWHGTPLKTLGKKIKNDFHNIGNTMKNFYVADYLLYPNEYTKDHMIEDYMIENLAENEIVLNGYPRNTIFFDDKSADNIRDKYHLQNKKVIAYMPTWRGTVANKSKNEQIDEVLLYLGKIDKKLDDHSIMYVNFHPIIHAEIDFSSFKKIRSFPSNVETYEFLNACDLLITDYSSVFFDYAITRKKIILFTYDADEYFQDRGVYLPIEHLPFPRVNTVDELIHEINKPIQYDDKEFIESFCKYDNIDASKELLNLLLFNKKSNLKIEKMKNNGKKNILIYGGNFSKNGITSALLNLLHNIDVEKFNYFVTFTSAKVASHKQTLLTLPKGVNYIPNTGKMNTSIFEKIYLLYMRKTKLNIDLGSKKLDRLYKNEIKRCYGNIQFSDVVQYSGYEFKRQLMFGRFDCRRTIFVHSNMVEEISVRKTQNPNALRYAYNHYDKIALVTEDMKKPTMSFCNDESKFCVANNIIGYKNIIKKSYSEPEFDDTTESTVSLEKLNEIFTSDSKVFVTIGRFSPEKGHKRLLNSFNRLWNGNKNIYLIIIGGHGVLYKETLEYASNLEAHDHIIIIKSLLNPYPFLKRCDYFVFTSFHEGFGLVLAEADILGVPSMSTNILGPRGFMEKNNGLLVENNEDGIYEGMLKMLNGEVKCMNVDYEAYNQQAIRDFEAIFD